MFTGMKLAGIIIICCGFILVLTPSNWADIVRRIIKYCMNILMNTKHHSVFPDGAGGHLTLLQMEL